MENVRWFKLTSWHVWSPSRSRGELLRSLCGRWATAELVDDRPGGEKSCESCLRLVSPK